MRHSLPLLTPFGPAIAILLIALAASGAHAQEQGKGFRYAKAQPGPRVATSAAVVVKPVEAPQVVMTWEVDQDGSGFARDENYVVGIDTVALYSDGRMRWTFYLKNKSDRNYATNIMGAKTYLADMQTETFKPIDMQYKTTGDEYRRIVVRAGCKERFWFDFPAPRKETDTFKVGLAVEDFFLAGLPFKPFTVKLVEPISVGGRPGPIRPKQQPEAKAEGGLTVLEAVPAEERPGGMTRFPEPVRGGAPPLSGLGKAQLVQAMYAIIDNGLRFNGDLRNTNKNHDMARIVFEKCHSDTMHVQARIFSQRFSSTSFKVEGKLIEDGEAESGLAFDLKGPGAVMYRFTLQGEDLIATDAKGKVYLFHPVK